MTRFCGMQRRGSGDAMNVAPRASRRHSLCALTDVVALAQRTPVLRKPALFHAIARDLDEPTSPSKSTSGSHGVRMLQRLGSTRARVPTVVTPRTATLVRKFTVASGSFAPERMVRQTSASHLQLMPHLKDANLCADTAVPAALRQRSVWATETVATPTQWLFPKEEQFESVLCRRCSAYLKAALVQPLPFGWLELPPDGDDRTCYYDKRSHEVLSAPPDGVSEVARRVFNATGSVYTVCACRMTWVRRQHLLRKIKQYANRYKENVHWSVATELELVYDRHFKDPPLDDPCRLT
ncbi:hypothetical protein ACHHYP_06604 [Achlya hypogyna]|uniref:WW domain-containing protein n=1 Tax=Achlya hypogyna TaxID=1202772 RepID=A0A1V9YTA4_ACHHY|nr:hypothetical protein ACHHYP_06604 [Achlya hypogyna]